MVKVFQLSVKIYLLNNIKQEDALNEICSFIDTTLARDEEFLELHNKNCYKMYSFNSFYPVEKDRVYKEDKIYTFQIRTIDVKLANYLLNELHKSYTSSIKGIKVEAKEINRHHIEKVYSITPVLIKNDFGYWKNHMSIDEYANRLKINMIKKYNEFTGENIKEDFPIFNSLKFDNKKPIAIKYKNIKILGDKLTLNISDDELSQKIAYMCIGVGAGECNARGCGFLNYRWL
ncbi:CRISPR-associated endoribonuclease Cas6 [Clostridium perfringens]|uniref:CRISPR-associated endoribonuclease Cas6 n=1 Tax=Clostridium perfringens TaxID=1502 RepID=UPI001A7E92F9|nr:CRISPR-associated endoribonuclease Cas6 [Clostridium perfringens]